ncbi:DUF6950 family protein [Sphingomonas aurantiaca]|uniref:DUF6950 family protein n=1 Tax=Sphingomonas aurantiaca TaxID=185949 RepID=UPI0038B3BDF5
MAAASLSRRRRVPICRQDGRGADPVGKSSTGCGALTDPEWCEHCGDKWRAHVLATTGADICDVVGSSPRRPRDWVAIMRRLAVRDMSGVISAVHGAAIPYRQARRGDIVRRGWAIGICRGDRAEFFGGVMVPMNAVDQVWRLQAVLDCPLNAATGYSPNF